MVFTVKPFQNYKRLFMFMCTQNNWFWHMAKNDSKRIIFLSTWIAHISHSLFMKTLPWQQRYLSSQNKLYDNDNVVLRNFWCKIIADEILWANILLYDTTTINEFNVIEIFNYYIILYIIANIWIIFEGMLYDICEKILRITWRFCQGNLFLVFCKWTSHYCRVKKNPLRSRCKCLQQLKTKILLSIYK